MNPIRAFAGRRDSLHIYFSTAILLDHLESLGFPYKRVAKVCFKEFGCPTWGSMGPKRGCITLPYGYYEPGVIAHEWGHGAHEVLRREGGFPDLFGEDYANAIRFFVDNAAWREKVKKSTKNNATLIRCNFELDLFLKNLQSGIIA